LLVRPSASGLLFFSLVRLSLFRHPSAPPLPLTLNDLGVRLKLAPRWGQIGGKSEEGLAVPRPIFLFCGRNTIGSATKLELENQSSIALRAVFFFVPWFANPCARKRPGAGWLCKQRHVRVGLFLFSFWSFFFFSFLFAQPSRRAGSRSAT